MKRPFAYGLLISLALVGILSAISVILIMCSSPYKGSSDLEDVKNARFVRYSKDGMYAVDYDLIIDMETGVQYMIVPYVGVTVLMNPDGTPVVTTE